MLTPSDTLNRAYLEADLISGLIDGSDLHHLGIPELRKANFSEAPGLTVERILSSVEPSDLSPGTARILITFRRAWKEGKRLRWDLCGNEGVWLADHGLAILGYASRAARRLVALAEAEGRYRQAQTSAVDATGAAREALRGL